MPVDINSHLMPKLSVLQVASILHCWWVNPNVLHVVEMTGLPTAGCALWAMFTVRHFPVRSMMLIVLGYDHKRKVRGWVCPYR